jgi:hypothetical protein
MRYDIKCAIFLAESEDMEYSVAKNVLTTRKG